VEESERSGHDAGHKAEKDGGKERRIVLLTANAVIVFRVSPLISAGIKASIKLGILEAR